MRQEEINQLSQNIKEISCHFEPKPLTGNVKPLKEDFDIKSIDNPKHYWKVIEELEEVLRETRLLFLYSVLDKVCQEEGKPYYFDVPFQVSMRYDAVIKKERSFYLQDEDGDYREIFTSEDFVRFIDDLYWEEYESDEE